jgi:hypothetical protein
MMRIFYSDYGGDVARIAKIERLVTELMAGGATVMRTGGKGLQSAAAVLPLPGFARRSKVSAEIRLDAKEIGQDPVVALAAAIFRHDSPNRSAADAYASMLAYQAFIAAELDRFAPDLVIAWHQFSAYHSLLEDWCRTRSVPIIYAEHGVLPGSWCFEFRGQMAESWIAQAPEAFAALPLDEADREAAERYLDHARRERLNRKTDTLSLEEANLGGLLQAEKRPKILYAGNNDYKTGLQPFSPHRSLRHGGDFLSTESGLLALLRIARRRNLLVLYKPHPSLGDGADVPAEFRRQVLLVDRRVNLVDLLPHVQALATIVSQSAYMAAMHGIPVVLMGRMQLSGTGIVEEAPFRRDLDAAVGRALANANPEERRRLFRDHVARLLRYYLIADSHDALGLFRYDLGTLAQALLAMDPGALRQGLAAAPA